MNKIRTICYTSSVILYQSSAYKCIKMKIVELTVHSITVFDRLNSLTLYSFRFIKENRSTDYDVQWLLPFHVLYNNRCMQTLQARTFRQIDSIECMGDSVENFNPLTCTCINCILHKFYVHSLGRAKVDERHMIFVFFVLMLIYILYVTMTLTYL